MRLWEWVDSGSVPSTGIARVPTTGNGELGPLAPPLHAASDTGESCAWEYQHNTELLPHSLYSTHQQLVYHSPQSTTNQTHTTMVCQTVSFIPVIVEAISSSDSFCVRIMFSRAPSFCQLRLVSLKCVPFIRPKTYTGKTYSIRGQYSWRASLGLYNVCK